MKQASMREAFFSGHSNYFCQEKWRERELGRYETLGLY